MAKGKAFGGRPHTENPQSWCDVNQVASEATPRRDVLLCKKVMTSLVFALCMMSCVLGKTIYVNSAADDGEGSLRTALSTAEDGDVIRFSITTPIKLTSELTIPFGWFGVSGLTIEGNAYNKTILDGRSSTRILNALPNNKIILANLILRNGRVSNAGGAIYNDNSFLTIRDCEFLDNVAEQTLEDRGSTYGGALYNNNGNVQISNCVFSGCYVNAKRYSTSGGVDTEVGGAICSKGGHLTVSQSDFHDNRSQGQGGAIFCSDGNCLTIENCDFTENVSWSSTGFIWATAVCCLNGEFGIYDSKFSNNSPFTNAVDRASFLAGTLNRSVSGAFALGCASVTGRIERTSFTGNLGGAFYSSNFLEYDIPNQIDIADCVFADNISADTSVAQEGSVVMINSDSTKVRNSRFERNKANWRYNAVVVACGGVKLFEGCSFTGNYGWAEDSEALVFCYCDATVSRCTFSENNGGCIGLCYKSTDSANLFVSSSTFVSNVSHGTATSLKGWGFGTQAGAICFPGRGGLIVTNSLFKDNVANNCGGAIVGKNMQVVDCSFLGNQSCTCGGAIYDSGEAQIRRCRFVGNVCTNGNGGAISGCGLVDECLFVSNRATNCGGAISTYSVVKGNQILKSSFICNRASSGGAIGYIKVPRSTRIDGHLGGRDYGKVVNVCGCSFSGNVADIGSAVQFRGILLNSTFVGDMGRTAVYLTDDSDAINNLVMNGSFHALNGTGTVQFNAYDKFSLVTDREGGIGNIVDLDVATVAQGMEGEKPLSEVCTVNGIEQTIFPLRSESPIAGRGVFLWHDDTWGNVAYSVTKTSTKYPVCGNETMATILIDKDQVGNPIEYPATMGALAITGVQVPVNQVLFDANGGSSPIPSAKSVVNGMPIGELPEVIWEQYPFKGWFTANGEAVLPEMLITSNMTVFAHWAAYRVTFIANGGMGTMAVQMFAKGKEQALSPNAFTYADHTFDGWATRPGGEVVYTDGQSITVSADMTLYAVWAPVPQPDPEPDPEPEPGSPSFTVVGGVLTAVDLNGATEVVIPDGVTSLAEGVFDECANLTRVKIPASVIDVGKVPFWRGGALLAIDVDEGNPVYKSIDGVLYDKRVETLVRFPDGRVSVSIPDSVTAIARSAFNACTNLSEVIVPDGVTDIGMYAFAYCTGLTNIVMSSSVANIGAGAFCVCWQVPKITLPEGITEIRDETFASCHSLTDFKIPLSVTSIGHEAFLYCNSLVELIVPPGVVSIGTNAFAYCTGLWHVGMPYLADLPDDVFEGCREDLLISYWFGTIYFDANGGTVDEASRDVTCGKAIGKLPEPVLEEHEFLGWFRTDAEEGDGPVTEETIMRDSFTVQARWRENGLPSGTPSFTVEDGVLTAVGLNGATEVVVPDNVTSIGSEAFAELAGLTSVTIPASVTNIHAYAFDYCAGLVAVTVAEGNPCYKSAGGLLLSKDGKTLVQGFNGDVVIPSGVTCIGDSAFYGCTGLTSVTMSEGVVDIQEYAFGDCSGLTSVVIPASVADMGEDAFCGCGNLTNVVFRGDAPRSVGDALYCQYDEDDACYNGVSPECVIRVNNGSTGWDVDIPGTWHGMRIEYIGGGVPVSGNPSFTIVEGVLTAVALNGATEVTIPEGVTAIGERAFYHCTNLVSVSFPKTLRRIGDWAFDICFALETADLPQGLESVGRYAFEGAALKRVEIPEGVTSIPEAAFACCPGLAQVVIPATVTSIGSMAFCDSQVDMSIVFHGNAPKIGEDAFHHFSGSTYTAYVKRGSTGWGVTIPGTWNGMRIEYLEGDVPPAPASTPGTITVTTEATAAGRVMRLVFHRTGGSDGRIAVKVKTQTSTGICGTDFAYVKEVLVWEDGDASDKVIEIPTYGSGAGKQLRVKLATLTTGAYAGCVTPKLAESKVYADMTEPNPGTITVTAPIPLSGTAGDVLRMTFSRTGGSDGKIAVKAKTQTSTALMGVNGSADFDYVKKTFEWGDGDATDRYLDIPTYVQPWEGVKMLRVKLATLATGAYAGNLTPALAESKIYAQIESPVAFGTVYVAPDVQRPAAGETLRLVFRRTGGSSYPIAVKYKVQTSTAVAGTDFEYKKGVVTWGDGEADEKVVEVPTYPSAVGKQLRVKLSTLTQGAYEGCVTPHLNAAKVYVPLR